MVATSQVPSSRTRWHERLRNRLLRLETRLDRAIATRTTIRLVAGLTTLVCGVSALYDQLWLPYGPPALLGALVFMAFFPHGAAHALAPKVRMRRRMVDEAIARLTQNWGEAGDDGSEYLEAGRPGLGELQVFGRGSLFQLMNRTGLPWSRDHLADLLSEGVGHREVAERQSAARELTELSVFRHRVEAEARVVDVDRAALERLLAWAEEEPQTPWLDAVFWTSLILVPSTIILVSLRLAEVLPSYWYLTFLLQLVIFGITTARLSAQYALIIGNPRERPVVALRHVFARIEKRRFYNDFLKASQAQLLGQDTRPSERIHRFEGILESLAVRHSPMLYAILAIGLMWEVVQCRRLERWRQQFGHQLRKDIEALCEFEVLVSVGGLAADNPEFSWPEVGALAAQVPPISATQLGHPLISPQARRCNDFVIDPNGRLVLVTGSNMSGKSTFLRTLGVNVRLALMGAPVCADTLQIVECDLATSIQVVDSPGEGMSRFYAEVKRLSEVLKAVDESQTSQGRPQLYLIDEMLSGTNSRERGIASREIVRRLVAADRSFGLVTTHDLALVSIESELVGQVVCYHFSDLFDGTSLHFDYTLKDGVAQTTNALHVLAMEGIHIEVDG